MTTTRPLWCRNLGAWLSFWVLSGCAIEPFDPGSEDSSDDGSDAASESESGSEDGSTSSSDEPPCIDPHFVVFLAPGRESHVEVPAGLQVARMFADDTMA